ncbi:hypothetical protein KIN20_038417 [Parelaphostrongylus tenuis]|uniref:Reverse transcriptase domain-containing protein n=1 Tax=Parelaphostrongylus tenuis TaxID=148309 RepID=A0AAD5QQ74_PARTN|nr:hypothetical protein KIN20_038417 [Parelaphostrongylus tenuis]
MLAAALNMFITRAFLYVRGDRTDRNCVFILLKTVSQLIEVCWEHYTLLVLNIIDYEKAFDIVDINTIVSALVNQAVASFNTRKLKDCYRNCSTKYGFSIRPLPYPSKRCSTRRHCISKAVQCCSVVHDTMLSKLKKEEKRLRCA